MQRRRGVSLLLAVLWVLVTNHCVFAQALVSLEVKPSDRAQHECCHDEEVDASSKVPLHAESCGDVGCCQPILKEYGSSVAELVGKQAGSVVTEVPLLLSYLSSVASVLETPATLLVFADPPGVVDQLLHSLSVAPNAPSL